MQCFAVIESSLTIDRYKLFKKKKSVSNTDNAFIYTRQYGAESYKWMYVNNVLIAHENAVKFAV